MRLGKQYPCQGRAVEPGESRRAMACAAPESQAPHLVLHIAVVALDSLISTWQKFQN